MRMKIEAFKLPAIELCEIRGKNPEELTFFGNSPDKRPLWMNYAEQLRALNEKLVVLDNHFHNDVKDDWHE